MRKILAMVLALLSFTLAFPTDSAAQEAAGGVKHANVDWYFVSFAKFKEGTEQVALEIIYDHFVQADRAVGRDPLPFDSATGAWDHVVFFPLEGGPADLEWEVRPIDAEWFAALAELEGGAEEAQALLTRYNDLVQDSEVHLVRKRR
ncbi:MAG: hypothetical protein ACYTG0_34680 [Planctomycetota bacterium]|jgi:hypothetical protein